MLIWNVMGETRLEQHGVTSLIGASDRFWRRVDTKADKDILCRHLGAMAPGQQVPTSTASAATLSFRFMVR